MYPILGTHHVSAMTDDIERNYKFFTEIIGMRLVKKTVNQDDTRTYHAFYSDDVGHAGTDMTFFDVPGQKRGVSGNNSIHRASLRVPSDDAIIYYKKRFEEFGVLSGEITELFGRKILRFEEPDGMKYFLISDENDHSKLKGTPWKNGPVPEAYAVHALGPVEIHTKYPELMIDTLTELYGFQLSREEGSYVLLEVHDGGNEASVILKKSNEKSARPGSGEIHHVALMVEDMDALKYWESLYESRGLNHSGIRDRFYFSALYVRIKHILFELSTKGPGFMTDEAYETLGENLALPPFLEPKREEIENELKLFETRR
ncbi:VOC family protein [Phocicoccus pinnipedialis]|uniref:Ring-cleaving dioxygenase MhqA n=1 Tax=Phocicoccus pinnipedialis TaxID=110845 RepID=A0A6V7R5G5_9BACL|nr:VOC family protein [Jeotgalicoccus pinnipedialis]MBP1939633.1 glyoxalase family protein [Jeotgalicoccus pinnipedialis]CAD2072255.1 Putative ring-cleaving dioxygenase MhqA [Jeotgalicoccus pinnipedialis]